MGGKRFLTGFALALLAAQAGAAEYTFRAKLEGVKAEETALYDFTSHRFTSCNRSGPEGPSISACRLAYGSAWTQSASFLTQGAFLGYQRWRVPDDGRYTIVAAGAKGANTNGRAGGAGARLGATFELVGGEWLTIAVGQSGQGARNGAGGGGGSYVVRESTGEPLIIAGGGGGAQSNNSGYDAQSANLTTAGDPPEIEGCGTTPNRSGGAGSVGYGGIGGCAGGGSGWNGTGALGNHSAGGGSTFANGLGGGISTNANGTPHGGFGGGGAGSPAAGYGGGGGGYSGGGGGGYNGKASGGGGAGSFISITPTQQGANEGWGYVEITKLSE